MSTDRETPRRIFRVESCNGRYYVTARNTREVRLRLLRGGVDGECVKSMTAIANAGEDGGGTTAPRPGDGRAA